MTDSETHHAITIDGDLCRGHGRCYAAHPALFTSDDEGFAVVNIADVVGDDVTAARAAAEACPEGAITLTTGSRPAPALDDGSR